MKLLLFTAVWCPPCKVLKKLNVLEDLKAKRPELEVLSKDVDEVENIELSKKYEISSIPTFALIDNSGNLVKKHTGILKLAELEKFLE